MSRFRFYVDKAHFLIAFIWWRNWRLVKDEWNVTYAQRLDTEAHSDEICREAAERLLRAIEEE